MQILLIVISTCIAVALLTVGILYPILTRRTLVQERLEALGAKEQPRLSVTTKRTPWQDFLASLGGRIKVSPKEQTKYTRMIVAAGYRKESVAIFLGLKVILACALPLAFILFYALPKGALLTFDSLLYAVAMAIAGFLLPSFWLRRKVEARKTEIFHTLPDILDLLTVCVEAGLGLDAALIRASDNPMFKGNPLAEELKIASMETRAGKLRADALRDMAERTMVDDIKSFATMLVQTERFGTSLSLALRVHSDTLRTKRRQIAEEAAAKTAIKILFPLAFFIFPTLLIIMVGPAFYKIAGIFK
ncbi:MAG TPA: type II secretion system F family protein [Geobacteraceae bacterium]